MATTEALPLVCSNTKRKLAVSRRDGLLLSAGLTILALLIHGYHPYAEDGGIYLPAIERLLHPQLFPTWGDFVSVHARWSFFAPMIALVVRLSHVDLLIAIFVIYLLSMGATLYGAWELTRLCECSRLACSGAVTTVALALTIPIAGTSLMLMDPYVTGRSISTPSALFAICGMVAARREMKEAGRVEWKTAGGVLGALVLASIMHPLMAADAFGCILFFFCFSFRSRWVRLTAGSVLWVLAIATGAAIYWSAPSQNVAYVVAAQTRSYWFISKWSWYEVVGIVAPLMVLWLLWGGRESRGAARVLAQTAIAAGISAVSVALFFVHASSTNESVARLQPLRVYQTIYLLMLIALGAFVGEQMMRRHAARWIAFVLLLGGGMFMVQQSIYASSAHLEFPWTAPVNSWERAFLWIRDNTGSGAVFALDANYISAPGEDAQSFRAIAERSAPPDYSKDGGAAAIAPDLAVQWQNGASLQAHLNEGLDDERIARLREAGVDWVVITRGAAAKLKCPYMNERVKVCRIEYR